MARRITLSAKDKFLIFLELGLRGVDTRNIQFPEYGYIREDGGVAIHLEPVVEVIDCDLIITP